MLQNVAFDKAFDEINDVIYEWLEGYDGIDIDDGDDNVSIKVVKTGKEFLLSKHYCSSELWLSSPVSGAHHFPFDSYEKKFKNDSKGNDLLFLLREQIDVKEE